MGTQPLERHYYGLSSRHEIPCSARTELGNCCRQYAVRIEVRCTNDLVMPTARCEAHIGQDLGGALTRYEDAQEVARQASELRQRLAAGQGDLARYAQENNQLRLRVAALEAGEACERLIVSAPPHTHRFTIVIAERYENLHSGGNRKTIEAMACECGATRAIEKDVLAFA